MKAQLDHVGIAVKSLADAIPAFEAALGVSASGHEEVLDQDVRVAFLKTGEPAIELLEPMGPDGPIGKFIQKRGEGIHHLSFDVPDIEAALARCKAAGLILIDEHPRQGAAGKRIAFLHPKSTSGVLIELSQDTGKAHERSQD
jgi:methylmalonyl-CoA/ethylmalonyl-CoA epimerase